MADQDGARVRLTAVVKRFSLGGGQVLTAIKKVSFEIGPASVTALSGPSGSGKSTLLNLIGAIEQADEGTIEVNGLDLTGRSRRDLAAYRRTVGFVFQRYNLLPALTALDNVISPVLPYKAGYDKRARARELLDAVGLSDRAGALPSRLSGGQQQRVAIARALMNSPRLLLADEPTGNLDSRTGAEIIDLLLELRADRGMTVVIATHEPHVMARCDQMFRLSDGEIIASHGIFGTGTPESTLARLTGLG